MSDEKPGRGAEDVFANGPSLTRERSRADARVERERQVMDHALTSLTKITGPTESKLLRMRELLRMLLETEREKADGEQEKERTATDGVLRDARRSHRDVLRRLSEELKRARSATEQETAARVTAEDKGGSERTGEIQALWMVMAELDAIGSAADSIRHEVKGTSEQIDALTCEIEAATCRVLELVGELLDPQDNRGVHHDEGGSG